MQSPARPGVLDTSLSLLSRLQTSPESAAWDHLVRLYTPLIREWLRKYDIQDCDCDDLLQEVLVAVAADVGKFDHAGRRGAFRGWLKAILLNRLRKYWRTRDRRPQTRGDSHIDARLMQLADPDSATSRLWNREHDEYVLRQLLTAAEPHFAATTWQAFCRIALDGEAPGVVAEELGMTVNAVCIAKSRVLSRLRLESDGLVESSSGFLAKS